MTFFNPFYATGFFLYLLEILEKFWFVNVFRRYGIKWSKQQIFFDSLFMKTYFKKAYSKKLSSFIN